MTKQRLRVSRRTFVAGSTASAAAIQISAIAQVAPPVLTLFGLRGIENEGGVVRFDEAAGITVRGQVAIVHDAAGASLVARSFEVRTPRLKMMLSTKGNVRIPLVARANEYAFRPGDALSHHSDVTFEVTLLGNALDGSHWQFGCPWFSMNVDGVTTGRDAGLAVDASGVLCVKVPGAKILHEEDNGGSGAQWPLELCIAEPRQSISHLLVRLDLVAQTARLEKGALVLRAHIGYRKPTRGSPMSDGFDQLFDSDVVNLDFTREPTDPLNLKFHPRDDRKLLLNVGKRTGSGNTCATVFGTNYALHVAVLPSRFGASIESISIGAGADKQFRLTTTALVDSRDEAAIWFVAEPIALKVRPADVINVSSFLLAPQVDASLRLSERSTLHGVVSAAKLRRVTKATLAGATEDIASSWTLNSKSNADLPLNTPSSEDLRAEDTRVVLVIKEDGFILDKAKPGRTFHADSGIPSAADTWEFSGGNGVALMMIPESLAAGTRQYRATLAALNTSLAIKPPRAKVKARSVHESRIEERLPDGALGTISLDKMYVANGNVRQLVASRAIPSLDESFVVRATNVDYVLGKIKLIGTVASPRHRAYVPIYSHNLVHESGEGSVEFQLDRWSIAFAVKLEFRGQRGVKPCGVLKLSDELSLSEVLAEKEFSGVLTAEAKGRLHRDICEKSWKGLLLFSPKLASPKQEIFRRILPVDADGNPTVPVEYIAMTPSKGNLEGGSDISLYARVYMHRSDAEAKQQPKYADATESDEGAFRLDHLDIEWADSSMERFAANVTVHVRSLFGVRWAGRESRKLAISGYLQRAPKKEVRWTANLAKPVDLLGGDAGTPWGPIKQLSVRGGTIAQVGDDVRVLFDGDIKLQSLNFKNSEWLRSAESIRFSDLGLSLPKPGVSWLNLHFTYPSFRVDLNARHFDFLKLPGVQIKLTGLGVDWDQIDWKNWFTLKGGDIQLSRAFYVDFDLSFGKLPALAAKTFKEFKFGLRFGIGIKDGKFGDPWDIRLGALGFKKLNLDLMRFLTVTADNVELSPVHLTTPITTLSGESVSEVPLLTLNKVAISVMDTPIIHDLNFLAFATPHNNRRAFLLSEAREDGKPIFSSNLLSIYWILIGRDISFPQDLARSILSLNAVAKQIGGGAENPHSDVAKRLNKEFSTAAKVVSSALDPKNQLSDAWVFGAGIGILDDFLQGKFLFQDGNVYGLALWGEAFEKWFGEKLAVSGMYLKRPNPAEDSIVVSAVIPGFSPGPFRFTGGVVSFEWGFNGSFLVDIGFPWPDGDGSRQWHRSLGAIVTPYQGSGGVYFRYRKTLVQPSTGEAQKYVQIAAGVAVQFGFGATYGSGTSFVVWARIGLYAVIEGEAWFNVTKKEIRALHLTGAFGILAEGYGQLDIWIISIRVGVMVSAEARAEIFWVDSGDDAETVKALLCLGPQPAGNPDPTCLAHIKTDRVELRLTFELAARAYASACIGPRGFRVCKSFSIRTSISVSKSVYL